MKKITMAVAAAAALLASAGAHAQFYVGGAAGLGQTDVDCSGIMSCDDSATGVKVYGGYKLSDNIAVEAAVMNFGTLKVRDYDGFRADVTGTSLGINFVLMGDLSPKLNGAVRFGLASNTFKSEYYDPYYFGYGTTEESKIKPHFGLSLGYRVVKGLTIEAGIDFTQFELNDETAAARLFSVGAKYQF